jgi:hypothetical protein
MVATRGYRIDVWAGCGTTGACRLTLKLAAKLPGHQRATTIARASTRGSGARMRVVHFRLSAKARKALVRTRTLKATLSVESRAGDGAVRKVKQRVRLYRPRVRN